MFYLCFCCVHYDGYDELDVMNVMELCFCCVSG
jgi:hypothetical protein